jgi:hypothetical protein
VFKSRSWCCYRQIALEIMMVDPDLICVNGIDFDTGKYAVEPVSVEDLARTIRGQPGVAPIAETRGDAVETFGAPFGLDMDKLDQVGWGIVFSEDCPPEVRTALKPLMELRHGQAGELFKELSYRRGEQTRDWYGRNGVSIGVTNPEVVPYYLLLIGSPDEIPFEFQYLMNIDYAVGRLAFETPAEYSQYVSSLIAYENTQALTNKKEVAYWGTHHLGDRATELSASLLVDPLANGVAGVPGLLKRPIHLDVGYGRTLALGDDATKESLHGLLHGEKSPALLFTASHGMSVQAGRPNQRAVQGALLCQDWPTFSNVRPEHILTAADVGDDANIHGLIGVVFACFGAGTPQTDQFPSDLSHPLSAPPLAEHPFVAALPQRLLAHPRGGALAIIGHVDRAWSYSIKPAQANGSQIVFFRNALGEVLSGSCVGRAVSQQFSSRFASLSAALASQLSPTLPAAQRPSDRALVSSWIERNDAQNYMLLGDPAARIRAELLS